MSEIQHLMSDEAPAKTRQRRLLIISITAVAAMIVYMLMPPTMNELARRMVPIFLVAAVLWATEALPLFATSFIVIGLQIVFLADRGGLANQIPAVSLLAGIAQEPRPSISYERFLAPFASGIIILFLGGFLLSAAVAKHGLDRVIAGKLLRPLSHRPILLLMAILGISAFFSMWMSNTATAAMMLVVVVPVVASLPKESRFQRALILAVPFGANIGGIGTPIGTPPNAVALANLRAAGYEIGFVDWMMLAMPLVFVLLLIAGGVLIWLMPPEKGLKLREMERPPKLDRQGWITGLILVTAIVLWLTASWHGMAEAVVALLAAAALTAFRVLERADVDSIDWNILILMWGGLSLGNAMQETGLVDQITSLPLDQVEGWMLATFVVLLGVGLSTFMSNTATAALVVPMALVLSPVEGPQLAILTALACSFAMAMPVSTPPNAIAFASGRIQASDMLRAGTILSIVGVIMLLIGYRVMLPLVLNA